jgi:1-acyl-sn-glycerol-3-phosphate acyltransferase
MIAWLRFAWTLASTLLHVILGLLIAATVFPFVDDTRHSRVVRWWARRLLAILRVEVNVFGPNPGTEASPETIEGALRLGGPGAVLVLNHVSWLDIFIVHAQRPAHFIAKAEISRWPLLGFLVGRSGTIFIERGKRHAVREINHRIASMLEAGHLVGVFPEGTTSDGNRLLPFHANLIQPAINVGVPVVVAGVRYRNLRGGRTNATLYIDDINLLQSLMRIARHGPLRAELHLIDAFDSVGASRHELVRKARGLIADALDLGDSALETAEGMSILVVPGIRRASARPGNEPETLFDPRDELL